MRFCTRHHETHLTVSCALAYVKVEGERAGDTARLAIVHVSSHSRQRHKVVTVMVLAMVSTRLPSQNGHVVGRVTASLNRDSDIVAMFLSVVLGLFF